MAKYKLVFFAVIIFSLGLVVGAGIIVCMLQDNKNQSYIKREIVRGLLPPAPPYTGQSDLALKFPPSSLPSPATTTKSAGGTWNTVREYTELSFPENTLDTTDWLTFRSEKLGFEVKYPKGWEVLLLEPDINAPFISGMDIGSVSIVPLSNKLKSLQDYESGTLIAVERKSKEQTRGGAQKLKEGVFSDGVIDHNGYEVSQVVQVNGGKRIPSGLYIVSADTIEYYFFEKGNPLIFQKILLSFKPL